ncbi:MAG: hypothetical protein NDJ19_04530 [Ramlibacter sp.]|nr:hypothetical protein [Ramlibacter sp.]
MKIVVPLALALGSFSCQAGTIYLCKAYGGGTFWAASHCNQHNALIERIVSVPDGMPFHQQVQLAEQQRRPGMSTGSHSSTTTTTTTSRGPSAQDVQAECAALDGRVASLDALARQPQSAQMHDWIRGERKKGRDRQFAIRCR